MRGWQVTLTFDPDEEPLITVLFAMIFKFLPEVKIS